MRTLTEDQRIKIAAYKPKIRIIQRVVAEHYGLTLSDLQKHRREANFIKARQRVHYFTRKLVEGCPLEIIGIITGNGKPFNHSTVCHSVRVVEGLAEFRNRAGELVYPEAVRELRMIEKKLEKELTTNRYQYSRGVNHLRVVMRRGRRYKNLLKTPY